MITTIPAGTLPQTHGRGRIPADDDAASAQAAGATAFALLLDTGAAAPVGAPPGGSKKDTAEDEQEATPRACDPATLLGAIAAGREGAAVHAMAPQAHPATASASQPAADGESAMIPSARSGTAASASTRREDGQARKSAGERDLSPPQDEIQASGQAQPLQRQPAAGQAEPASAAISVATPPPPHATIAAPSEALQRQPHIDATASSTMGAPGVTPPHAAAPAPAPVQAGTAATADLGVLRLSDGTAKWDDGLSSRILWMAGNDVQAASIRLDPPELGPIEVRLTVTADADAGTLASVQFSAAHPATREAIESALPRLHEMLRDNGISLGNASVGTGLPGQAQAFADAGDGSSGQPARHVPEPAPGAAPVAAGTTARRGSGLIDTFA